MTAAETFAPLMRDVAVTLLGEPDKEANNHETLRWGNRGSFKVDVSGGVWHDKEANEGGGVLDLVMREKRCDKAGALQWLEGEGLIQPRADDVTRYLYHAADGSVSYAKARVDKPDQKYQYQHFDGQCWRAGRNGAAAIPYRLPRLLAAPEGVDIYMVEGEKHADKLAGWGLIATSLKDWHRNFGKYVKGRTVVILPDNDEPGEKQAADAARLVREGGGKPVLVRLRGLPKSGDIMDWQGTYDDLAALVMEADAAQALDAPKPAFTRGISAAALMAKHFEPVNYVVPGLLAEGATLFAGKPKIGKSWMAYDFAIAIASGRPVFGSIPITQGDTLYLALEDSERRLKSRLLKKGIRNPPERLTLVTEWPDLDNGCIAELEAWADSVERPSLVIVDVLKMVRGVTRSTESLYDADYRALTGLATFARNRGIAVMIVHHVRKMEADDPLESISGTNGLTGAADTVMVLKRDIGTPNCTLYVRGRDVEEAEKAVRFVPDIGTWELLGDASEVGRTDERQAILETLRSKSNPMTARDISDILGKNYDAIRKTMTRMWNADEIVKTGRGLYHCLNCPKPTPTGHWDTCDRGYEFSRLGPV
jgi:hypothetical protein